MSDKQKIISLNKGHTNNYESPLTNKYTEDYIAVLHWYQKNGWEGVCGYGDAFFMLLSAMCFTKIESDYKGDRFDRFITYIEGGLLARHLGRKGISESLICENIRKCTRKTVDENLKQILRQTDHQISIGYEQAWCPSRNFLLSIFDQLDQNKICDFVIYLIKNSSHLSDEYKYYLAYWPHLIICKGDEFIFVEVSRSKRGTKRLSKVHDFCNEVLVPFDFDVEYVAINGRKDKAVDIGDRILRLEQINGKQWRSPLTGKAVGTEQAVFDWYKFDGWGGTTGEGDVIFFLLKCMSYKNIPIAACGHDKYKKNKYGTYDIVGRPRVLPYNIFADLSLPENRRQGALREWGDLNERLADLKSITSEEVGDNFDTICSEPFYFSGTEEDYHRRFTKDMIKGFVDCFDRDQLVSLAQRLSVHKEGYTLSFGWPDLTLFKEGKIIFREVKANRDKLRENQERLIVEVLMPLGFDVEIVSLRPSK